MLAQSNQLNDVDAPRIFFFSCFALFLVAAWLVCRPLRSRLSVIRRTMLFVHHSTDREINRRDLSWLIIRCKFHGPWLKEKRRMESVSTINYLFRSTRIGHGERDWWLATRETRKNRKAPGTVHIIVFITGNIAITPSIDDKCNLRTRTVDNP